MNQQQLKYAAEVMAAAADGAKIQYRPRYLDLSTRNWSDIKTPTWDWFAYDYRVAIPKVKLSIVEWHSRSRNYVGWSTVPNENLTTYLRSMGINFDNVHVVGEVEVDDNRKN